MEFQFKENYDVNDLVAIVQKLRAPDGCPWDKVQTHQSIRNDFIEEVYEAVEAIDEQDTAHLREELGDVLLQVVFHTVLEMEQQHFTLTDVAGDVCRKMILRHPHVFGHVVAETPEEVIKNWDEIKMQSKFQQNVSEAMETVSKALPSLMRSRKLWKKAESGGAALSDTTAALQLAEQKLADLKACAENGQTEVCSAKLGELLFSLAGLSRFLQTDCEQSLYNACDAFIDRFKVLERDAAAKGVTIQNLSSEEIAKLWNDNTSLSN